MVLIYLTLSITLFAIFNGIVISWAHSFKRQRKYLSHVWHIIGRIVIGLVAGWEWYNLESKDTVMAILFAATVFNLSWTVWDLVINLVRKSIGKENIDILHVDSKGINSIVLKVISPTWFWILRAILIIINIIALWIY